MTAVPLMATGAGAMSACAGMLEHEAAATMTAPTIARVSRPDGRDERSSGRMS